MARTLLDPSVVIVDSFDRSKLRADTPGCDHRVHLNNAGSAPSPSVVTEAIIEHLRLEEAVGGYEAAQARTEQIATGRAGVARLVNADADDIAFMESSTVALHRILSTLPIRRGDRVLVAASEYGSTILPLLQLTRRLGVRLDIIPDGEDGSLDASSLDRLLDDDVRAVFAVQCPSHNGLVNDVTALGRRLRDLGSHAWYVVDACQSVGQVPVDVGEIGADFLYASGRKFLRGPRGTGFLYVAPRAMAGLDGFPTDVHGGEWTNSDSFQLADTAIRFENFERSYANFMGLFRAVDYLQETGQHGVFAAIQRNAEFLRCRIGATPGYQVLDRGAHRSGIVTFVHTRLTAADVVGALAAASVTASVVRPGINPVDLDGRSTVRLSPHAFNDESDLNLALRTLSELS